MADVVDESPQSPQQRCQFRPGGKICPLPVRQGASFCGAHDAARPECPACGTRLRDAAALKKHVTARCPVTRRRRVAQQANWYSASTNLPPPSTANNIPVARALPLVLHTLQTALPAPRKMRAPAALPELRLISDAWSDQRDSSVKMQPKHFTQIASLCALALSSHTPSQPHQPAVIELGAGRAYTAMFAANVLSLRDDPPHVLVTDRHTTRWKADRTLRAWQSTGKIASFTRCTTDLADLDMRRLPFLQTCNRVYILGKHLCGDASDLAIYGATRLARHLHQHANDTPAVITLVLACCCRALCTDRTYTFDQCLKPHISPSEFAAITPCCALGLDEKRRNKPHLGNQCRLLIDSARVQWMNANGWQAALCTYTKVSPENTCIVATWNPNKLTNANLS
ncbi:tRNA:m(4)X modification enzyme TRM13 [Gracilariopsis chorda]|uniref:tRNA:m(4)X modification enzyme TRM13 n=1 Tax=Gracilariopsis chorda TaxID=448386 RepID=A0A2V3IEY3_9FLOR|nr:tRNA:m(4)X modification enzyme TRM13 [Gracilariopsis chorda]|eukprot:PXF40578.1 tRNA:m(4)X modification enzyme TRM13 [Gracilariopsis chorda]